MSFLRVFTPHDPDDAGSAPDPIEGAAPLELDARHRYAVAAGLIANCRVVDLDCHDGAGSNLLAQAGAHVLGLMPDAAAVRQGQAGYGGPRLRFAIGTPQAIPADDAGLDAVLLLRRPIGLAAIPAVLDAARRVLKPDGFALVAVTGPGAERAQAVAATHFPASDAIRQDFFQASAIHRRTGADELRQNRSQGVNAPVWLVLAGAALPTAWLAAPDGDDAGPGHTAPDDGETPLALAQTRQKLALARAEIDYLRRKIAARPD